MTRTPQLSATRAATVALMAASPVLSFAAANVHAGDTTPPRHERASSWRTVVVPAVSEVVPALREPPRPATRPVPVETASLHKPVDAPATGQPKLLGPGHALDGIASYYWQEQMTASGERFDKSGMTAAHRTLPFGTRVRVTHVASGRSVVVRINDRGPFTKGRVIDLSEAAARTIGMTGTGLAHVRISVVAGADRTPATR